MLKVTGLQKTNNGLYSKDPIVKTTVHLFPMGKITVDLIFVDQETNTQNFFQSIGGIKREDLLYDPTITDPYDCVLNAVENWLIQNFFDKSVQVEVVSSGAQQP